MLTSVSRSHSEEQIQLDAMIIHYESKESKLAQQSTAQSSDEENQQSVTVTIHSSAPKESKSTPTSASQSPDEEKQIPKLQYISSIREELIIELEKKFNKTRHDLDEELIKNSKVYDFFLSISRIAKASNVFFSYSLIRYGNQAIRACIKAFFKNRGISDTACYLITIPTAVLDFVLFTLVFSSHEAAVIDTLGYIHQKPIRERVSNILKMFKEKPHLFAMEVIHTLSTLLPNSTISAPRMLAIEQPLRKLPVAARWPVTLPLTYIGVYFAEKYYPYRENYDSVLQEIRSGTFFKSTSFFTRLHIFIQGSCLILSNAYPQNWFLAQASGKLLGFWPHPIAVALLTVWQQIFSILPSSIKYYREDSLEIDKLLKDKYIKKVTAVLKAKQIFDNKDFVRIAPEEIPSDAIELLFGKKLRVHVDKYDLGQKNEDELNFIAEKTIAKYREIELEPAIKLKQKNFHVIREDKSIIPTLLLGCIIGIYASTRISSSLSESNQMPFYGGMLLFAPILSILLNLPTLKAESTLITQKELRKSLENESEEKAVEEKKAEEPSKNKGLSLSVDIMNAGSGFVSGLLLIASMVNLSEDHNFLVAVLFIAIQSMLNLMRFNREKVIKTIEGISLSSSIHTIFSFRKKEVIEQKQEKTAEVIQSIPSKNNNPQPKV